MDYFSARCLLFTPANKPERFSKAKELGADGVIIDLEDAIALSEKDSARQTVIHFLKKRQPEQNFLYAVRINSIRTRAGLKDLIALCEEGVRPDILVLPKSEGAHEIEIINELLAPETIPLLPLIETAKGLYQAKEIANAQAVKGLIFGGADYSVDIGANMAWEPLYDARTQLVQAAATAGIAAIDVPYLHLKDADDSGIIEETKKVKALGYTCKLAIHPKHIQPILKTLLPTSEEVEQAKRVVEAYESAQGNACELDGKMIDVPVYRAAKRVLS